MSVSLAAIELADFPRTMGQAEVVLAAAKLGTGLIHCAGLARKCFLTDRQIRRIVRVMERRNLFRRYRWGTSTEWLECWPRMYWREVLVPKALLVMEVHTRDGRHKLPVRISGATDGRDGRKLFWLGAGPVAGGPASVPGGMERERPMAEITGA